MNIGIRSAIAAAAVLSVTLGLAACSIGPESSADETTGEPVIGGTAQFIADVEPTCFDPHTFGSISSASITQNIFESLVFPGTDGEYYPWLAEEWSISDDGKEYTFKLRPDVVFHDGTKLDAEVIKQNFDHWTAPETKSTAGSSLGYVETRIDDELTATIVLAEPKAAFLQSVSMFNGSIISGKSLTEHRDTLCAGGPDLAGTGPFVFAEYTKGLGLRFERFEDYPGAPAQGGHAGPAYLDAVEISFLPEVGVRVGALTSGQADIIANVSPVNFATIESQEGLSISSVPFTGLSYTLYLNTQNGPTADQSVRETLLQGLDIDTLIESTYLGAIDRAWSVVAPNTPPVGTYNEALEGTWGQKSATEVGKILDEGGWKDVDAQGYRVKNGERLTLRWLVNSANIREQREVLGEAIVSQAKELGIEIVREVVDPGTFATRAAEGDYELTDLSQQRSEADLLNAAVLNSNRTPDKRGFNYGWVQNAELDALLEEADKTTDSELRAKNYREVQQIVIDNAYVVPLYVPAYFGGVNDRVQNLTFTLSGYPAWFQDVWLTDGAPAS